MSILDILKPPPETKETYYTRHLGYGVIQYQVEKRYQDDIGDWDWHYETGQATGTIVETPRYLKIIDNQGGTLIIAHRAVDQLVVHDSKAAFESYLMHAELNHMEDNG